MHPDRAEMGGPATASRGDEIPARHPCKAADGLPLPSAKRMGARMRGVHDDRSGASRTEPKQCCRHYRIVAAMYRLDEMTPASAK